jgi:DNA-directed RNA polymerase subunit RPC12/RpoP
VPSFHASYRCGQCKNRFKALIDVDVHRDAIAGRNPPTLTCPSCGERSAAYEGAREAFARQAAQVAADGGGPVAATASAGDADQPQLSAHHEGETTRLVLVGEMTTGVRWRSAIDDLDGEVVVDLTRVSNVSGGGVSPLVTALRAAPRTVKGMVVLGCPLGLAEALRAKPIPNLRIGSVLIEGDCPGCRQPRRGLLELKGDSLEDALQRDVPCTICGTALVRARNADDLPHRSLPLRLILGVSGLLAVVGTGVVLVGIVLAGVGEIRARMDRDMAEGSAAEQRLQIGPDRVTARGHGGPYGTAAEAEAAARDKALGVLISALGKAISEARGVSAGSVDVPPSAVAKVVAAVDLEVEQMLVGSEVTEGDGGFEVDAEYALDRARFDKIVADYAAERSWGPLKLIRPFPPSPGLRVVKSSLDGVQSGTRVVRVGETAVHELGQLPDAASGLAVVVQDTDGKERTVELP